MTDNVAQANLISTPADRRPVWRQWWPVVVVALLAGLLHVSPFLRASSVTPDGWTFTGNLSGSPDRMQYRVWTRESLSSGVLVRNSLTSEPNPPHIPVFFYFGLGKLATWLDVSHEAMSYAVGGVLAVIFVFTLFFTIRLFTTTAPQLWWTFGVILIGGGLGGYFKFMSRMPLITNRPTVSHIVLNGANAEPLFDDYRSHYVLATLFDTHFLLVLILTTAVTVSLYFTLKSFSWQKLALTVALAFLITVLHVYESVNVVVVAMATVACCYPHLPKPKMALLTTVAVGGVVLVGLFAVVMVWRSSGLPSPLWRADPIQGSTLLLAFPIAWLMLAIGGLKYWQEGGLSERFLMGWALGLTALTLSGPFYPYPDRGTMTLQIPLYVMAGAIFFKRWGTMRPAAIAIVVLALGSTPAWILLRTWEVSAFDPTFPYKYHNADHHEILGALNDRAGHDDVLMVNKRLEAWKTADLWLAPTYPGTLYAGHFFLTIDYDRKRAEVEAFFNGTLEDRPGFLEEKNIRFVFANPEDDPERLQAEVSSLVPLAANEAGTLFEVRADNGDGP